MATTNSGSKSSTPPTSNYGGGLLSSLNTLGNLGSLFHKAPSTKIQTSTTSQNSISAPVNISLYSPNSPPSNGALTSRLVSSPYMGGSESERGAYTPGSYGYSLSGNTYQPTPFSITAPRNYLLYGGVALGLLVLIYLMYKG